MSRYIDADKLPRYGKRGGVVYWRDIEAQPTADVVEVVRCEDCIDGEPEGDDSDFIICRYKGGERNMYDFYCKYGERAKA